MRTWWCPAWLVSLALLSSAVPAGYHGDPPQEALGTISGAVLFTGNVPLPREIMTTDGGIIKHSDLVVDPKTNGLRHVVVILEDEPARRKLQKAGAVLLDQRDMVFLPRVVAVQHGQAVRFENNDLCNHSVMASATVEDDQFNLFVTQEKPVEHVFAVQKHPVQIGCSIHPWMRAWVFIVPHPWFAVTDEKGRFSIDRVPPGKYTLLLRHPDTGHLERRPVEVDGGKRTELKVEWSKAGE
jgi:plastocyanin